ncbi:MAG TPA: imidazolonepropionase [Steroidobacteraceae bacterium]|nr:imidazolonepropionase [Steroidobacteraceae bacterium]
MRNVPIAWDRVWVGADLATMDEAGGIGHVPDAALAIRGGRIAWVGTREQLQAISWSAPVVTEARGLWITPGLIECHTHLVYAGDRSNEFAARLRGATYEDIARAGGGIVSTMRATRAASEADLLAQSLPRARALVSEGVTTLEVKSGYGLDLASELKMLRVAQRLGAELGIDVIKTFLGAHALPPEFANRQDDYINHVCDDMLPAVTAEQLADAADVFCERIAFTREQTERVFERARNAGLKLRLHADQLSDGGGGELAARYGALSADHLEYASDVSLQLMARNGVIAGLLPGAFYFLRETRLPPIEKMRALGVQMAVSTDCNPGTSPIASILLAMNMACVLFRMTATEVLRGVTVNAARALGLSEDRGTLRAGMRADLAIWKLRHPEQLCAEVGAHRPVEIAVGRALARHP